MTSRSYDALVGSVAAITIIVIIVLSVAVFAGNCDYGRRGMTEAIETTNEN